MSSLMLKSLAGIILRRMAATVLLAFAPLVALAAQEPVQFTVREDLAACLKVRARPESSAPSFVCLDPARRSRRWEWLRTGAR